jgi:hypothetical protein
MHASDGDRQVGPAQEFVRTWARTPEELETLFEDALLVGDSQSLAQLFESGALLVAGAQSARGAVEIEQLAKATWQGDHPYVADPWQIHQARDLALVVADQRLNVARRCRDGSWRFVILLQLAAMQSERCRDVIRG